MTARMECGCTPPNVAPSPREPAIIAGELADAAEYMDALANRIHALGTDCGERESAELDVLAQGLGRVACELRMRQQAARQVRHA